MTQAQADAVTTSATLAWKLLGYLEIIAGVFGLALGTVSFFFGGIVAYVIVGLDVVMVGVVAYLMRNLST